MTAGDVDYDVLIAGAGLVGLALAAALVESGLSVAVADRAGTTASDDPRAPDVWDNRVYAISPGSAEFLRGLGTWQALPADRVTPIETMRIEGDSGARLDFSAYELGERALAWIVEERELRAALVRRVREAGLAIHAPCTFESLSFDRSAASLGLADGTRLAARLLVGADGLRSWVREAAGLKADIKRYGQTAVVANFACERAHHGRAYQWFRDDGSVLAWLPLPGRRVSIVWSAPERLADELLALPGNELAARIAAAGAYALGGFECITGSAGFALQLMKVATSVAGRLVLVGDAAHGIHPLAGQGVNLGFGDVAELAAVLSERGPLTDAGERFLLDLYACRRAEPVLAMQTVTDSLAVLFNTANPLLKSGRNLGMATLNRLSPAKRLLAQAALR
jgi:ubiquinone biosynthesis UbiH/UbiF/VisC/COQ6 family hydroxylase